MDIEPYDYGEKIYPQELGSIRIRTRNRYFHGNSVLCWVDNDYNKALDACFIEDGEWYIAEFPEIPAGRHMLFLPVEVDFAHTGYQKVTDMTSIRKTKVTVYKGRETIIDLP